MMISKVKKFGAPAAEESDVAKDNVPQKRTVLKLDFRSLIKGK